MKPFEQLVTDHGALVLRVCRVLLGPADAEDAWSETFLAALRSYPELPAGANTEAWLVTIAHRKAIDALRRRDRLPVPMPADLLPDRPDTRRSGPGSGPGSDEPGSDHDGLWQYVAALPLRQREAIAYHYLAGLPYKEAAALTGSTPAAMRRAAADGIRKLRNIYALEGAL